MRSRADAEGWVNDRTKAERKVVAQTTQKVADLASDNATRAERIKRKLLIRLEREIDALPEKIGSESSGSIIEWTKNQHGNKIRKETTQVNKLRDLTAAYKDLTEDMPKVADNTTLDKLDAMLEEVRASAFNS